MPEANFFYQAGRGQGRGLTLWSTRRSSAAAPALDLAALLRDVRGPGAPRWQNYPELIALHKALRGAGWAASTTRLHLLAYDILHAAYQREQFYPKGFSRSARRARERAKAVKEKADPRRALHPQIGESEQELQELQADPGCALPDLTGCRIDA